MTRHPDPVPYRTHATHGSRENEVGWVRGFMARTAAQDLSPQEPEWHVTGILALVIAIGLTLWICWAAWSYDSSDEKADPVKGYGPVRAQY